MLMEIDVQQPIRLGIHQRKGGSTLQNYDITERLSYRPPHRQRKHTEIFSEWPRP
jgi:hypothetical protein